MISGQVQITSVERGKQKWGTAKPDRQTIQFLQGPQARGFELVQALRIFIELIRGFRTLHFVGPCATSSARRASTKITRILDEVFETVTLIQTRKIADFPIVCMGRDYSTSKCSGFAISLVLILAGAVMTAPWTWRFALAGLVSGVTD